MIRKMVSFFNILACFIMAPLTLILLIVGIAFVKGDMNIPLSQGNIAWLWIVYSVCWSWLLSKNS